MIKVIIFDGDGVVISPQLMFAKKLADNYGITTAKTSSFFNGIFQECLVDKADLREELSKYLNEWGWPGTTDELINYWLKCDHNIDQNVINDIQRLRQNGIKCYLGSNQEKYRTDYMIDKMNFGNLFDGVFTSANIGHKKPDQEFFQKVYNKIEGLKPNEIMFWDDSPRYTEGAKKFGYDARLYKNYDEFHQSIKELL